MKRSLAYTAICVLLAIMLMGASNCAPITMLVYTNYSGVQTATPTMQLFEYISKRNLSARADRGQLFKYF